MTVNADVTNLDPILVEENDPQVNPLGVKGVGELVLLALLPPSRTPFFMQPESAFGNSRLRRTN